MTTKEYNSAVDNFADGLYRFALKLLCNEMSVQDMVQECYIKAWEKHEDIDASKIKSYLFTTIYRLCLNVIEKEKRNISIEYYKEQQGTKLNSNFDVKATLDWALNKLPEIQKSVVLLRDYEGYAYDEIGEICNLSESQVKVYIFRARKTLKEILKDIELVA